MHFCSSLPPMDLNDAVQLLAAISFQPMRASS
jgi:hypothetical protein